MTFSDALTLLKQGKKLRRSSWAENRSIKVIIVGSVLSLDEACNCLRLIDGNTKMLSGADLPYPNMPHICVPKSTPAVQLSDEDTTADDWTLASGEVVTSLSVAQDNASGSSLAQLV